MSLIGKELCEFKLQAFHEDKFITVEKKNLLGKWAVLFFYPADFTFVCPTELVDLADNYDEFKKLGCEIYSVSTDNHYVHKAWKDASDSIKKIKYPMLSDNTHVLSRYLDVLIESAGIAERATFVIDPDGKIVSYEVIAGNVGRSSEELLRRLRALEFVRKFGNEVCPAKWKPGDATLKPGIDLVGKI